MHTVLFCTCESSSDSPLHWGGWVVFIYICYSILCFMAFHTVFADLFLSTSYKYLLSSFRKHRKDSSFKHVYKVTFLIDLLNYEAKYVTFFLICLKETYNSIILCDLFINNMLLKSTLKQAYCNQLWLSFRLQRINQYNLYLQWLMLQILLALDCFSWEVLLNQF